MATLEERLQRLEEIDAIRRLKQVYARTLDRFAPGDEFAALFTDDRVLDLGPMGLFEGRPAIAEFFNGARETFSFFLHYTDGDIIDVLPSGTEATGTWYMWEPATRKGQAVLIAITYDEKYRKVEERWLFAYSRSTYHFVTPYESGWVRQPFPADMDAAHGDRER